MTNIKIEELKTIASNSNSPLAVERINAISNVVDSRRKRGVSESDIQAYVDQLYNGMKRS